MIHLSIDIWKGIDSRFRSGENIRPILTTYILGGEWKRGAVLILPGGCYRFTSPREAEPVALHYMASGYHAFVLDYSVGPNRFPEALRDTFRALTLIRQKSAEWKIDTEKIVVCGFSAGGHLAASAGVFWNRPGLWNSEGIEICSVRPNALILAYPVINSTDFTHHESIRNLLGPDAAAEMVELVSLDKQVSPTTPPTFLWHTVEDELVPVENSLLFADAMRKNNVPFDLHVYSRGIHGLSLATGETSNEKYIPDDNVATWMSLSVRWLRMLFDGRE